MENKITRLGELYIDYLSIYLLPGDLYSTDSVIDPLF